MCAQSSTLYIYYIYIELASTQSPFFQNLPYESTARIPNQNKDIEFWLSAHIVRAYPYMDQSMQITKIALIQLYKILKVTKRCMQRLVICSSLVFVVPYKDMRGQYVQITKIRYPCFDLVHSRYTRMAGFGRREIELMQALCIYDIYIEYYSMGLL